MKRRRQNTATPRLAAPSVRAEALSWPIGAAFLIVLALTYGAGVWWMARGMAVQAREAQITRAQAVADNLVSSLEPLLAAGDLSAARRLLTEAAYRNEFEVCQLTLSDGRPLADSDLSRPQLTVMPASWSGQDPAVPLTQVVGGRMMVDRPVVAMGRGSATLTIEQSMPPPSAAYAAVAPGAGAVGALGLVGMLLVYRQIRSRLQTLNLIRNALIKASREEETPDSVLVDPRMGSEAEGWNRLLVRKKMQDDAEAAARLEQISRVAGGGGALEAACDVVWHGMMVVDGSGRLVYLNGAAAALLGVASRDSVVGCHADDVLSDEQSKEALKGALVGGGAARVTIEVSRKVGDADNFLRFTVRRLSRGESGGAVIVIEDMTQQRVADHSRHDFIARATHELRSPLTNIRLYVETAQDEGENDPQLRGECLNVIGRESQRLERLVGEMLSVSEIEAGSMSIKRDDVRLDAVFKELEADYTAKAKDKRIDVTFDLPPKLPAIKGDREKLDVVLQNLMGNAVKYTPDGGKVRVHVEVSASELVVEVIDTGIGISEEDLPKVFEKFYRANDPRLGEITGSGLGLALAQEIVRMHGGDLTVESELNEGSTFCLMIPIRVEGV